MSDHVPALGDDRTGHAAPKPEPVVAALPYAVGPTPEPEHLPDPDVCWAATVACSTADTG